MRFNQPITGVSLPDSLQEITFSGDMRLMVSELKDFRLTVDDQEEFGVLSYFNQPITEVKWPPSLVRIAFGESFDQPVAGVVWPVSLRELAFSRDFGLPTSSFDWPESLEQLTIARRPIEPLPSWPGVRAFGIWRAYWDDS